MGTNKKPGGEKGTCQRDPGSGLRTVSGRGEGVGEGDNVKGRVGTRRDDRRKGTWQEFRGREARGVRGTRGKSRRNKLKKSGG